MELLSFFRWVNNSVLAIPSIILFCSAAIILTVKTRFLQIRGLPRCISLITDGIKRKKHSGKPGEMRTIDSIHALFAAMATTIGIGNIVSPSIAIMVGGPGALFWLILYIILGSSIKFAEVVFAMHTRIKTETGHIIGGPMRYLTLVNPWLATWYGCAMAALMAGWSGTSSKYIGINFSLRISSRMAHGACFSAFCLGNFTGGAKRVGDVATMLVPIMFVGYVTFALIILLKDITKLATACKLIVQGIVSPQAAAGGLISVTLLQALRTGIYRGIFITESGLGTSSIAHSMSDAQRPTDQGILAMF